MLFRVGVWLATLITFCGSHVSSFDWLSNGENQKCDVTRTREDIQGDITFKDEYMPRNYCLFITNPHSAMTVSFLSFNFGYEDENGNCTNYVEIGASSEHGWIEPTKKYCGTRAPPPYLTHYRVVKILIHTDHTIIGSEISLHYSGVRSCGGDVVVPIYTFITQPVDYYSNSHQHCGWYVSLHDHSPKVPIQVQLNVWELSDVFQDFACTDKLEIFDGKNGNSSLLARFDESTNSRATSDIVTTSGPHAYVLYTRNQTSRCFVQFNMTVKFKGYCLPGTLSCGDGETCYSEKQICDGNQDCYTGYDEQGCGGCPPTEFWCGKVNHNCYTLSQKCNGMKDCATNMEDEANCKSCGPGSFLCAVDNRCIYERWRCDGDFDCTDNSDEEGCPYSASRRVITAAVIGSLVCSLLLVIALGCTCKLYSLRASHHRHPHHHYRATPLTLVEREIFQRQAPPTYDMTVDGVSAEPPPPTRTQRQRRHRNRRYQFQRAMPASSVDEVSNSRSESIEECADPSATPQPVVGGSAPTPGAQQVTPVQPQQASSRDLRQSVASFMFESVPDILAEMLFASRQNQTGSVEQEGGTSTTQSTRCSTPLPIETRDSGTQTNSNNQNENSRTPTSAGSSRPPSSRRSSGRSSSRNRSHSRRSSRGTTSSNTSTRSRDQQAKPLPKKKKIQPVMVPAPCHDGVVEDTLTCVYPCPPSYSQAIAAGGRTNQSFDANTTDPTGSLLGENISSSSLGSSFEDSTEAGAASPNIQDSVFNITPKINSRARFSFPSAIGNALRSITTSPFSKFQKNPYLQMENPHLELQDDENTSIQVEGAGPVHSRRNRPSETSSDEDLIDCNVGGMPPVLGASSVASSAAPVNAAVTTVTSTNERLEKVFPPRRKGEDMVRLEEDSHELSDFSFNDV